MVAIIVLGLEPAELRRRVDAFLVVMFRRYEFRRSTASQVFDLSCHSQFRYNVVAEPGSGMTRSGLPYSVRIGTKY